MNPVTSTDNIRSLVRKTRTLCLSAYTPYIFVNLRKLVVVQVGAQFQRSKQLRIFPSLPLVVGPNSYTAKNRHTHSDLGYLDGTKHLHTYDKNKMADLTICNNMIHRSFKLRQVGGGNMLNLHYG